MKIGEYDVSDRELRKIVFDRDYDENSCLSRYKASLKFAFIWCLF